MSNVQLLVIYLKNYLKMSFPQIADVILFSVIGWIIYMIIQYYKYGEYHIEMMKKRMLLIVSCSFIFVMTIWGRKINMHNMNFHISIIYTYFEIIFKNNMEMLLQVIMNIFMFIPLGILLPYNFSCFQNRNKVIFLSLLVPSVIEFIQGILGIGTCEIVDVMHNALGMQIGKWIYFVVTNR